MTCEVCKGEFEPKKPNAKVCSAKCRKEKWRRAHAQAAADTSRALVPEIGDSDSGPRKVGAPIKLTASVQKTICRMVRAGNYLKIACAAAGISSDALSNWRKKGAAGEEPYAAFLGELERAALDCESALVKKWHDAAPEDWRAARDLLARRFPDRWGREVEEMPPGGIGVGLHITLDLRDRPEWYAKAAVTLPIDRSSREIESEDHRKRERDIENANVLATAPIKDTL